jgi:hypothetical protein
MSSLFAKDTAEMREKEKDIERQIARLQQLQRTAKQRQRPRKKESVL